MKILMIVAALCLVVPRATAQDPVKTLPQAYKLQFENDWVKVTRVHYAPLVKLPAHEHTLTASAYVYLNDSGPVVFKHINAKYGAINRPATKAGSFRVYHGVQEVHEVENKSELPSDFLRLEFKTEALGEKSLHGRFFREDYPAGENYQKVQFENEQVRITRLVCAPGKTLDLTTSATEPSLWIALTPAQLSISKGKGKAASVKLEPGQSRWVAINQQEQVANANATPAEWLRFDFKTRPLSKADLEKLKKHEHPKN